MTKKPLLIGLTSASLVLGLTAVSPAAALPTASPPGALALRGGPVLSEARAVASTYTNPVSADFADTFADPAVIRGKDGWWYAFGTSDPLREGEGTHHIVPISRSADLVDWEYLGDAFTAENLPTWAEPGTAIWAPDIRYVDGEYRLYYVVTQTTITPGPNDNAIGVATAPTPVGPWTDSGAPVVGPRPGASGNPDDFKWTFDPSHVVGPDGVEYLYYGSYYGGIWVTQLSEDGRQAVGEPVMVAIDNKYEGAFVIQRDGWWYLFASSANCCAGPTTGYSVHVGRSESITGPFLDREGVSMTESRAGGTPVIAPNGNEWVGTGHNTVVTDLAGQDWMVYHAIDRDDPYLDEPFGINERPMLIDRLDWIDGWPTVNAGAWASNTPQTGPVTEGRNVANFSGDLRDWRTTGSWEMRHDEDSGHYQASTGRAMILTRSTYARDLRAEADVRLEAGAAPVPFGLVAGVRRTGADRITATVDPGTLQLTVEVTRGVGGPYGSTARESVAIPATVDLTTWHSLVLEVRDGMVHAELSNARLGDPVAVVMLDLPEGTRRAGNAGAFAGGAGVGVDNLSVVPAAQEVEEAVALPQPGALDPLMTDEFDGALGAGWTEVRDPDVTVADGMLVWQVEATDLVGAGNTAGLLLQDAPDGDWTAETKLTIDLGTDTIRNYQQAGLIAYVGDDLFARLSHVAIWNTRQTEFGYEIPYEGRTSFGGTIIGPPAETTWLRIVHRTDENGEHEVQGFTSRDGETWVAGGVWTFPAGSDIQIGLVSHGAAPGEDPATAQFDYFRLYQDARVS